LLVGGVIPTLPTLVDDAIGSLQPFDVIQIELGIRRPAEASRFIGQQQPRGRHRVPCPAAFHLATGNLHRRADLQGTDREVVVKPGSMSIHGRGETFPESIQDLLDGMQPRLGSVSRDHVAVQEPDGLQPAAMITMEVGDHQVPHVTRGELDPCPLRGLPPHGQDHAGAIDGDPPLLHLHQP
jgi:hypothetical protein